MKKSVDTVAKAIAERKQPGQRFIVAIAGAPGAGKSTLADALCDRLNRADGYCAAVLPMDGFHLDNAILEERDLLAVKGAPQTFDADGFAALLNRICPGDKDVIIPVFDRDLDIARAGGRLISAAVEIVIVEGNYLLLDRAEWAQLVDFFDLSVSLDVPIETLEKRLIQRWLDHGLDPDAANKRARGNDITNAKLVIRNSLPADIKLEETGGVAALDKVTLSC